MKKTVSTIIFIFFFLFIFSLNVVASEHNIGIGLIFGEPTGLSIKYWLNKNNALDLALAWSFAENLSFTIYADYLFHIYDILNFENKQFPLYFGIGANLNFDIENLVLKCRIPLGITYIFNSICL
ncbi:unnamed protein product, partial [marine sediment metagenome]